MLRSSLRAKKESMVGWNWRLRAGVQSDGMIEVVERGVQMLECLLVDANDEVDADCGVNEARA